MQFCDECGSLMHTEGDTWVCCSCENEEPRDSQAEAAMSTQDQYFTKPLS
jgi:RNA polymerases M/15 Kd subunit.